MSDLKTENWKRVLSPVKLKTGKWFSSPWKLKTLFLTLALLTAALPALADTPVPRFAYVANSGSNTVAVYTIDQTTGALTAGTAVAAGMSPHSVTVDPTGKFAYVANLFSYDVSVYTINQTTGSLIAGTAVAAGGGPTSGAVDPPGEVVFVA